MKFSLNVPVVPVKILTTVPPAAVFDPPEQAETDIREAMAASTAIVRRMPFLTFDVIVNPFDCS